MPHKLQKVFGCNAEDRQLSPQGEGRAGSRFEFEVQEEYLVLSGGGGGVDKGEEREELDVEQGQYQDRPGMAVTAPSGEWKWLERKMPR